MRAAVILPALLCASLTASSCATPGGGPLGFMMFDPNHHVPAAEPLFTRAEDECINASFLISVFSHKASTQSERSVCTRLRQQIWDSIPLGNLYDPREIAAADYRKRQRDALIGTLILASNKRCGDYVHFLQTYQGNVRVTSSLAAQAFATLATLATGNTAQWLAAGSAFSTGAGNTAYEVHFANKTVAMLTKAFDNARLDRLRAIQDKMQCRADQYQLPDAVGDVFDYHTSCSLTTGLMQAQDAVDQQRSPNLDTLAKLAEQIDAARAKLSKLGGALGQSQSAPAPAPAPAPSAKSISSADADGGATAAAAASGGSSTRAGVTNNVASPSPSTGTGGSAPPPATHVPTCPFTVAQNQLQQGQPPIAPKPKATPKPKPKAKRR